uniref:Carbohydrate (N-acetylgalactosamine 4-sulfate 6-O) sulfotransferase 15 n=1 Tax=Oryzias melastigma TaxID=30732 RepID=A0A3B3DBF7_ORYME
MPTSDDKHGSNTQTDYFNSLQSLSLAVIYGKRSVRTFLDFRDKNAPHGLDVKCAPLSFLTNLRRFSKAKVVSFFLCLTLAFLIMVSYTLMLDKRRMPLMSSYRPSLLVVPTGAFAGEDVSTEKSFMSTELMVKIISSIQEHKPRRVPDKKEITETDSNLFSVIPPHFLPNTKSPCWYEEVSGDASADPYKKNHFCLRSKSFRNTCDRMRDSFRRHLSHRDGKQFRLRCLPYFYIIGQPKCGTTDLFHRLLMHPEVKFNIIKEPHWWTRKRFGKGEVRSSVVEKLPIHYGNKKYSLAAENVLEEIIATATSMEITGDMRHHDSLCSLFVMKMTFCQLSFSGIKIALLEIKNNHIYQNFYHLEKKSSLLFLIHTVLNKYLNLKQKKKKLIVNKHVFLCFHE